MATPSDTSEVTEFRDALFARIHDAVESRATILEPPVLEPATDCGVADIHVPAAGGGGLVVETGPDGGCPRGRGAVGRARAFADALGAGLFATCTSTDAFLFHDPEGREPSRSEYYYDLRGRQTAEFVSDLLPAVETVHEGGTLPSQRERDRLIGILRSFHASLWPGCRALAVEAYGRDERFTRAFDRWIEAGGHADRDRRELFETVAKQYAYLLTTRAAVRETIPATARQPGAAGDGVGPRAIADGQPDLFEAFPVDAETRVKLGEFVGIVGSERVGEHEGLLGELYEELIPADERRALGQFYTHPGIAEALCRWAVARPDDPGGPGPELPRVLDPACGGGAFTLAAYRALEGTSPGASCREIADSLCAVDVNRFPLRLTALNLAGHVREGAEDLHLRHDSFFDVDPEADRLVGTRGDGTGGGEPYRFDAVVGNPPYIRQGDLRPNKEHFRRHLTALGPEGRTPYADGRKSLSRRSDAYVYFVTHATRFLRDGGRLAFVVPTKWLTTKYGIPFQQFLLDHYRIEGVVGFTARAFEDALVDTVLLMIERRAEASERRDATVHFVRIEEQVEPGDVVAAVDADLEVPAGSHVRIRDRPGYRVAALDQEHLLDRGPGKLLPYLRAPVEFVGLLEHPDLVPAADLAETRRGVMTGANDFFLLDEETLASWDLSERFCRPAVRSVAGVGSRVIREGDTDKYLFDVGEYVTEVERGVRGEVDGPDLGARVKASLRRDGFDAAHDYIRWGEREGFHERRSCRDRPVWFDLGELEPPEILHPKFFDERVFAIWNPDRLMPTNAVDCVSLRDGVDEGAMLGVLNSTVHKALLEIWGRAEGGGALQLMTYEVRTVPVLDVRALDRATRDGLADAHDRLVAGEQDAQRDLDSLVLGTLDLDVPVDRFRELYRATVRRRTESGAGAETPVRRSGTDT